MSCKFVNVMGIEWNFFNTIFSQTASLFSDIEHFDNALAFCDCKSLLMRFVLTIVYLFVYLKFNKCSINLNTSQAQYYVLYTTQADLSVICLKIILVNKHSMHRQMYALIESIRRY